MRLMALQLSLWKFAHPQANLVFQWNFPQGKVGVIATMHDAIQHGFVTVSKEGLAMLAELGWDARVPSAPTVNQVKVIIDAVYGSPDETE